MFTIKFIKSIHIRVTESEISEGVVLGLMRMLSIEVRFFNLPLVNFEYLKTLKKKKKGVRLLFWNPRVRM